MHHMYLLLYIFYKFWQHARHYTQLNCEDWNKYIYLQKRAPTFFLQFASMGGKMGSASSILRTGCSLQKRWDLNTGESSEIYLLLKDKSLPYWTVGHLSLLFSLATCFWGHWAVFNLHAHSWFSDSWEILVHITVLPSCLQTLAANAMHLKNFLLLKMVTLSHLLYLPLAFDILLLLGEDLCQREGSWLLGTDLLYS